MANIAWALTDGVWKRAADLTVLRDEPKFPPLSVQGLSSFRNGLSRGIIAEVNGRRSSGRTSISLHMLAAATGRGETCAVVDLHNTFDPTSAQAAGVALDRIVWVRCRGNAAHAMRTADLILHAGGFGVVLLDLCDAGARVLNQIPLSYWYRFRRAVEHTPTILLVCGDTPQAKSCASASISVRHRRLQWSGRAPFLLLRGIEVTAGASKPLFIQTVA